jgi:hypothetical protein
LNVSSKIHGAIFYFFPTIIGFTGDVHPRPAVAIFNPGGQCFSSSAFMDA